MHDLSRYFLLLFIMVLFISLCFLCSMLSGPVELSLKDIWQHIKADMPNPVHSLILNEIRLPRSLLALLGGASLGLAGAGMQCFLRNPLAEPGVMGLSAMAGLGAVLAIYTGLSQIFPLALPLMAITGALLCTLLIQLLAIRRGVLTLLLAGVSISSLAGALTGLVLNLSPNHFAALEIVFWLLGSLRDCNMDQIYLILPFTLVGWALLLASANDLNLLGLGEMVAKSQGVNLTRMQFFVITGAALCVGTTTAVCGVIGFVGLIAPHIMRIFVGHSPIRLIPASALAGALTLSLADIFVRLIAIDTELKLGVITALIGAPFFLVLLIRSRVNGYDW